MHYDCEHIHVHVHYLNPSNPTVFAQLLRFKEDNAGQLDSASNSLQQALERTKGNMNWVALNKEQVLEWLKNEMS